MIKPEIILSILVVVAMIGNTFLIYALKKSNTYIKRLEAELSKKLEGCSYDNYKERKGWIK